MIVVTTKAKKPSPRYIREMKKWIDRDIRVRQAQLVLWQKVMVEGQNLDDVLDTFRVSREEKGMISSLWTRTKGCVEIELAVSAAEPRTNQETNMQRTSDFDLMVASHLSGDVAMFRLLGGSKATPSKYHEHQHFEPADQKEHERANNGESVPDHCANCGHPSMGHHNGRCQKD